MNNKKLSIKLAIIATVFLLIAGSGFAYYSSNQQKNHLVKVEEQNNKIADLERKLDELTSMETSDQIFESEEQTPLSPNEENDSPESLSEVRTVIEYVPIVTEPQQKIFTEPIDVSSEMALKIINVSEVLNKEELSIVINWETTMKSDSRIIIEEGGLSSGIIFNSDQVDSTKHSVEIDLLVPSKTYDYKIIAEKEERTDSYFGKFQTPRNFLIFFEQLNSETEECTKIRIEDTEEVPLRSTALKLSPFRTNPNVAKASVIKTTDSSGEVVLCTKFDELKVTNVQTGIIYDFINQ